MVYQVCEWSENELKSMFNFAPEDTTSDDPDVLYSGEVINVESGGIKGLIDEESPQEVHKVFYPEEIENVMVAGTNYLDPRYYPLKVIRPDN